MLLVVLMILWNNLLDPFVHFGFNLPMKKCSSSDKQMGDSICQGGARSLSLEHIVLHL